MDPHTQDGFDQDEMAERYVRGRLGDAERLAFEEHVLECDACFDSLQEAQRFVSGIRYAAEAGLLDASAQSPKWWPGWHGWQWWPQRMAPAVALAAAAIVIIAAGLWVWSQRASVDAMARQKQVLAEQLATAQEQLASAQGEIAKLTVRRSPAPVAGQLPLAILDASRSAAGANEVTIPASADRFALWIQVDPEPSAQPVDVQVFDPQARVLAALNGLHENRYGALAIALPAASFPAGTYRIRVFRAGHILAREYLIKISIG